MWIPKWYFEAQSRKMNELERRVKKLELICLEEAKSKIASLCDEEAGTLACGALKVNTDKFLKPRLPEERGE